MALNLDQSYITGQDNDDLGVGKLRITTTNNLVLGQSFTPTLSGKLNQIDLYLKRIGTPTGNVWIRIFPDAADPTAGSQIGSDSATVDATAGISTSYTFTSFTFASPITLTPGVEYWALLYGDYSVGSSNNVFWGVDTTSPSYSGGIFGRYGNGGAAWEDLSTYDGLFKQYSDDVASPSRTSYAFFM